MITHIIYHIKGLKVGCCANLDERIKRYSQSKRKLLKVIEELHDATDQEAGDREWYWADLLGYRRYNHYTVTIKAMQSIPEDKRSEGPRKGAYARAAKQTPEQRSAAARAGGLKGGRRTAELGLSGWKTMPAEKRGCAIRGTCPHCGYESNRPTLVRLHFDRCPSAPGKAGSSTHGD